MGRTKAVEVTVGAFMAAGVLALFFLAMQVSNLSSLTGEPGYDVVARFDNVGGLKVRAPVTMAGVRVGRVKTIGFDKETFEAVVTLKLDARYDTIPDDTFAKIYTAGLLGEQYVSLDPGGSEEYLTSGSQVSLTQSALVLEDLISQFLFSKAEAGANE